MNETTQNTLDSQVEHRRDTALIRDLGTSCRKVEAMQKIPPRSDPVAGINRWVNAREGSATD